MKANKIYYVKRATSDNVSNVLIHYGIQGQKWGVRNGPPYPLGVSSMSSSEKYSKYAKAKKDYKTSKKEYTNALNKARSYSNTHAISQYIVKKNREESDKLWQDTSNKYEKYLSSKSDYKKAKSDRSTQEISSLLAIPPEEAERVKRYAKTTGILLGTAAGLFAVGYIYQNRESLGLTRSLKDNASLVIDTLENGTANKLDSINHPNAGGGNFPLKLNDPRLFNMSNIGIETAHQGYDTIGPSVIDKAINNPTNYGNLDFLLQNVRVNQIDDPMSCMFNPKAASRRLSCWSASHSYFLSALTGKDFTSKSFENLVDFNDFSKLYNTQPKIFDLFGNTKTDFVGDFGKKGTVPDASTAKKLVENVFANIGSNNNLTADGTRTIGFMQGGYRSITCHHQWNFEIFHHSDGSKTLTMLDGWAGQKYELATKTSSGVTQLNSTGMSGFIPELMHYNTESIRFYAPELKSINSKTMARYILGRRRLVR